VNKRHLASCQTVNNLFILNYAILRHVSSYINISISILVWNPFQWQLPCIWNVKFIEIIMNSVLWEKVLIPNTWSELQLEFQQFHPLISHTKFCVSEILSARRSKVIYYFSNVIFLAAIQNLLSIHKFSELCNYQPVFFLVIITFTWCNFFKKPFFFTIIHIVE
jgi:hypothetical protein